MASPSASATSSADQPVLSLAQVSNLLPCACFRNLSYIGVRKICNFRLKSPFIFETARDRAVVTIERLYEVISDLSNGIIFDDLE